jgi:hypothetical protein
VRRLLCLLVLAAAPSAAAAPQASVPVTERAAQGNVRAELSYLEETLAGGFTDYRDLRLTITRAGGVASWYLPPHTGSIDLMWPANGSVRGAKSVAVTDLDGDGVPEVALQLYTGGAHCCTEVFAFRWDGRAYRANAIDGGSSGIRQTDLDHDGRPEWVTADPSFEYLFTSFAGSGVPIRIYGYRNGVFADVTRTFRTEIARDAARWWGYYQQQRAHAPDDSRGVLAAWAADEYLLGAGAKVWAALAAANAHGDLTGDVAADWPAGAGYIAKLRRELHELGYS